MANVSEYFHMGGYAMFVWPAYSAALIGLVGILALSVKSWKAREDEFSGLKSSREQQSDAGASS